MNFVILGDGPEERAWAAAIAADPDHRVIAVFPGWGDVDTPRLARDFDDALATAGVDAAVVGGPTETRGEWLRRAAAEGLRIICRHPTGDDSEAYYQVALSRAETGAVIVPDLAARLHPGVLALKEALEGPEAAGWRALRYEADAEPDLARHAFARVVDLIRVMIGEIEAVTATGDPPGVRPTEALVVQLRAVGARPAEVRLGAGTDTGARLVLSGGGATLTLELPPGLDGPSRLIRRSADGQETLTEFAPWNGRAALLQILNDAAASRPARPDLADATRATEVAEGVVRSLRRGRTVELHYEEISEASTFKSVMTSLGCLVLLSILVLVPIALAGPTLGMPWLIYLAYVIPPMLVGFVVVQSLRFAIREPGPRPSG
jgi:predicted dehydrogenase